MGSLSGGKEGEQMERVLGGHLVVHGVELDGKDDLWKTDSTRECSGGSGGGQAADERVLRPKKEVSCERQQGRCSLRPWQGRG